MEWRDCELEASLGCTVRPCLVTTKGIIYQFKLQKSDFCEQKQLIGEQIIFKKNHDTSHKKIDLKWIMDLNEKSKIANLLENKWKRKLGDLSLMIAY